MQLRSSSHCDSGFVQFTTSMFCFYSSTRGGGEGVSHSKPEAYWSGRCQELCEELIRTVGAQNDPRLGPRILLYCAKFSTH